MFKESKTLEYKEKISKTFLKTVCAFANYNGGKIIFGVDDDLNIVGLDEIQKDKLSIENMINDSISPLPNYILEERSDKTIVLTVLSGNDKPYMLNGKTYKRNDTATIEVDKLELNRLILEGSNLNYEQLLVKEENLTFKELEKELVKELEIKNFNDDVLKTLELKDMNNHYNNAAVLLADQNTVKEIDIIRFGKDIDEIRDRLTVENQSILKAFHDAMDMFRKYYEYEKVTGEKREKVELIPEKAFRESLANAIVHRQWDTNTFIQISMFEDRIEITSPGGLPTYLSEEEYLNGRISVLRNPIIGNIFFRLKIIEKFGTGIARIKKEYEDLNSKPKFKVTDNYITVTLPVKTLNVEVSDDETKILKSLKNNKMLSRDQIAFEIDCKKDKTIRLLNNLIKRNLIDKIGNGRNVKYVKI
ncbi:MAG: putative DNA binding domain-containing protein [Clostridia bacterium]|nr:putative DNA binding domain-containing protein [Clostridia bacterium]